MTGYETLTELFDYFNQMHWKGRLPSYQVKQTLVGNDAGQCIPDERLILLHEDRMGGELIAGLLHEMIHARVGGYAPFDHGTDFVAELRRLVQEGETCLEADLSRYESRLAARFAEVDRRYTESRR